MAFDVHAGDESGRIEVAAELEVVVAGMELAMEAPLREIVANAGEDPSVVLNAVKEGKGNFGYNAQTGEYVDMIEFGILDPTFEFPILRLTVDPRANALQGSNSFGPFRWNGSRRKRVSVRTQLHDEGQALAVPADGQSLDVAAQVFQLGQGSQAAAGFATPAQQGVSLGHQQGTIG